MVRVTCLQLLFTVVHKVTFKACKEVYFSKLAIHLTF